MSSMCTIGRHGVPSLLMNTRPVVSAHAVKLFSTRSNRSRGETPYAVAFRKYTGLNSALASCDTSCSTSTFDRPIRCYPD